MHNLINVKKHHTIIFVTTATLQLIITKALVNTTKQHTKTTNISAKATKPYI
jgi:hypothetical protein